MVLFASRKLQYGQDSCGSLLHGKAQKRYVIVIIVIALFVIAFHLEYDFSENILFGIAPRHFERCDSLSILKNYCLLFDNLMDKEFHEAGQCILDILLSNSSSKRFWPYLLMECIPILEGNFRESVILLLESSLMRV